MGLDGEYDWSLEASQSQMVVHKDLTPPQLPVTPQNSNPVRIMPSRAAKSKKIKSRNMEDSSMTQCRIEKMLPAFRVVFEKRGKYYST